MAPRNARQPRARRQVPTAQAGRVLACAGLGLLTLAPMATAGAAGSGDGLRWRGTGDDGRLAGQVHLRADVSTDEPVAGWSLEALTAAGDGGFGSVCAETFTRPRDRFAVACQWDTTRYPDQRPSPNGRYLVRVMVERSGATTPAGPDREVALANLAAAPDGVTLTEDRNAGRATLTWNANREPDIVHYDVEERIGDSPWTRTAEPSDPRYERDLTDAGRHDYRVAAERLGPDGQPLGPGPWATPATRSASAPGSSDRRPNERPAGGQDASTGRAEHPSGARRDQPDARRDQPDAHPASRNDRRTGGHPTEPEASPAPNPSPADSGRPGESPGPGRTAPDRPPPPRRAETPDPPPADRSPVAFSGRSGAGLAGLVASAPAPAPPAPRPVPKPSPVTVVTRPAAPRLRPDPPPPEPDSGFEAALPYPAPGTAEAAAEAPTGAPAPPDTPTAATVAPAPRHLSSRRRWEAAALVVVGLGLLEAVRRPARRPSPSGDPAIWLRQIDDRLARLEARLDEQATS